MRKFIEERILEFLGLLDYLVKLIELSYTGIYRIKKLMSPLKRYIPICILFAWMVLLLLY